MARFPVCGGPYDGEVWSFKGPLVEVDGFVYRRVENVYELARLGAWRCANCGAFIVPHHGQAVPAACWCGEPRPKREA